MTAVVGKAIARQNAAQQGFSLLEVIIAFSMLSVGVLGMASLIPFAIKSDYRSRIDTTATFVATRELEQMMAQPFSAASFTDAPDDAATPATATVNLTAGGATLSGGNIDFSQAYSAVPAGYKRTYVIGATGVSNSVGLNSDSYDVRWNVAVNANNVMTIVIAARQVSPKPGSISIPANLRVVRMN